ncbi:RTA1-domain-containing protein [Irpex rosettiformis]|uniref:RTA1-domain-containing protein n=1 Tax=Irpex rosettiformis TaxID=378272 RepID=A0ACB8UER9_9APHY|nr:RTA1-domain-containing protein [Irpex rosettiformis]
MPLVQTIAISLAFATLAVAQSRQGLQPPADPFADPKHDVFNPLRYIASDSLSGMGVALALVLAFGQTFWSIKYRTKFMLAMVIAAYTYALGIAIRFGLSRHPDSSGLYIVEYLFVTLSPCGFIAAEYVLLGRLVRWLGGDRHMLIRPQRITLVFVISDVTTFLIQAAGGGVSASAHEDLKKAKAGSNIFLAGLALQLASFLFFIVLYLRFITRMYKFEKEAWVRDTHLPWYNDWRTLAAAFTVSCAGVLVRSIYRTVELSEGFGGYLSRTEVFFYTLDFVPLIVALLVYIPFWPGRFLPQEVTTDGLVSDESDAEKTVSGLKLKGPELEEIVTLRTRSADGGETLSERAGKEQ